MAKITWSTVVDHTSDAAFRTWGAEIGAQMANVSWVQTADTGQINWGTATRPGTNNTVAGYEIWRSPASSLYVKFEYGTGGAATRPAIYTTCGLGSDGAGNITGQTTTRRQAAGIAGVGSTVTALASYLCATDDFFGLCWKVQLLGTQMALGFAAYDKFVDSTGAATTDGMVSYSRPALDSVSSFPIYEPIKTSSTAVSYGTGSAFCVVPASITSSAIPGGNQTFLHFTPTTPLIRPVKNIFSILNSEAALSTTLTATTVGATSHTYISLNSTVGRGNSADSAHSVGLAMLWE